MKAFAQRSHELLNSSSQSPVFFWSSLKHRGEKIFCVHKSSARALKTKITNDYHEPAMMIPRNVQHEQRFREHDSEEDEADERETDTFRM